MLVQSEPGEPWTHRKNLSSASLYALYLVERKWFNIHTHPCIEPELDMKPPSRVSRLISSAIFILS